MGTWDKIVYIFALLLFGSMICAGVKVDCDGRPIACAICRHVDSTWQQAWQAARDAADNIGDMTK